MTRLPHLRVLGVDPGIDRCGLAVVERVGKTERVLFVDCVQTDKNQGDGLRLMQIHQEITRVCAEYLPDEAAVESLFFAKNVTNAIRVAQARGVIVMALAEAGIDYFAYTPLQIKQTLTGSGRAKKPQVGIMVRRRFSQDELGGQDDAIDAVAAAGCHLTRRLFGLIAGVAPTAGKTRLAAAVAAAQAGRRP